MNNNRCIACGEIIPEGRQICPNCEIKNNYKRLTMRGAETVYSALEKRLCEIENLIEDGKLISAEKAQELTVKTIFVLQSQNRALQAEIEQYKQTLENIKNYITEATK